MVLRWHSYKYSGRRISAVGPSSGHPSMLIFLLLFTSVFRLARSAVLVDFQVTQPPPVPQDARQCTIQILQRNFAFSFGSAEVVQFTPPSTCGPIGSWAAITLNFTVTSNGTQFDRLGIFTFQNVEIWRTSTPEPTRGDGIVWTYVKDVTRTRHSSPSLEHSYSSWTT